MVAQRRDEWISLEDFLALDRESLDQKYEYMNGHMYALAGGSSNHSVISVNTMAIIHNHLNDQSSPCVTYNADMTLKTQDACFLPDVMVSCNQKDIEENKTYIESPSLVVEVLSPSTMKRDRYDKLYSYTHCPSIQEYVLISQDRILVEIYTQNGLKWEYCAYSHGENVELHSIGLTFPIEELYRRAILSRETPLEEDI